MSASLPADGGLRSTRPFQRATLAFGAWLVAVTVIVTLLSQQSDDFAFAAALAAFSILAPVAVGVLWWRRRPHSRTGTLLVTLGGVLALTILVSADQPHLHALGVAAEPIAVAMVLALIVGFPDGRFGERRQRALVAFACVALSVMYLPQLIAAPEVSSIYPVYDCAPCPPNPFQLITLPAAALASLTGVGTVLAAAAALCVTVELVRRLRAARGPRRRMIASIAWTSVPLLPATAAYMLGWLFLGPQDELLTVAMIAVVCLWIAFPIGFAVPFVSEDVAAAATLRSLRGDLSESRRRDRWRDRLAATLDDPQLDVGFWDEQSGRYLDRDGNVLRRAPTPGDRFWFDIDNDGHPLAAVVADRSLTDSPEVMRATARATAVAVEADRTETTQRELLGRAATAAVAERSRMARAVQAGVQQRLAAMRVAVNMAAERWPEGGPDRLLGHVAAELDAATSDLREIVWAGGTATVARRGLGASLRSVTRAAPTTVHVLDRGLHRGHPQAELAVYYCCVEALQNAIKHAGPDVPVTIRLSDSPRGGIAFHVSDAGVGFDPEALREGVGLRTMRDRVEALGGHFRIVTRPGQGTVVSGWVPSIPETNEGLGA